MSSAGGAVTSVDKSAENKMLSKGTKANRYNSRNRNSRRNRGEMKLLGKYLDELRRNKSLNDLQTESEFEKVFAEGGVKIGNYHKKSLHLYHFLKYIGTNFQGRETCLFFFIATQVRRKDGSAISSIIIGRVSTKHSGTYSCRPANLEPAQIKLHVIRGNIYIDIFDI